MTRFILKNRLEDAESLKSFSWEGFNYNPRLSTDTQMVFTME